MCYTIEINLTREQLEKRFRADMDKHLPYRKQHRLSAFSLPDCPVVTSANPSRIVLYKWGLIPSWVKDASYADTIRLKTFNARGETVAEKPSFRHLIKDRKCVVLTSGFYEWQTRGKSKQPYFISVREAEGVALAGLYDCWIDKETGEELNTFTVITTAANPLMEEIHNTKKRMPLILDEKDEEAWIDPDLPVERTHKLIKPYDEKKMFAEEVDKVLFSRKQDENTQGTLF